MGLPGGAVLAMWWDIPPAARAEFEDWHSHEHMPERLRIPGFVRGIRWSSHGGQPSYYVHYEVASLDVLTSSPPYLDRLNNPTPWSTKMFPQFSGMIRSFCQVRASVGAGIGHSVATVRLSHGPGGEQAMTQRMTENALPSLVRTPGMVGAYLLKSEPRTAVPSTNEQSLRTGDAVADWVLLVTGDDAAAVEALLARGLDEDTLVAHGAAPGQVAAAYKLDYVLTRQDLEAA